MSIVGREALALQLVGAGMGSGMLPQHSEAGHSGSPGLSCVRAAGDQPGMMSSLPHRRRELAVAARAPRDAAGRLCSHQANEILYFRYSTLILMIEHFLQTYK